MGETLTERRRVGDEGIRVVKPCRGGRIRIMRKRYPMTVLLEEAPAKYVPAAAVIRIEQTLFGIIGRKGRVDG